LQPPCDAGHACTIVTNNTGSNMSVTRTVTRQWCHTFLELFLCTAAALPAASL
jgi:hypothetical protein